jgi:SAM-dependent methyltransferase
MRKGIFRKSKPSPLLPGGRVNVDGLSDEEFLDYIYKKMLGRDADPGGKAHQLKFLREGNSRAALVINIVEAPEFIYKIVRDNIGSYIQLLPIKDERPDRFEVIADRRGRERTYAFRVEKDSDFDWLEWKIIENGYYERPGVWSFIIDEDKRLLTDLSAKFAPSRVLDFGCANGAVLKCLRDKGIQGEGAEISRMALDKAFPEIRDDIHYGDLLELKLSRRYDLVLGLDVFEHLNPNKLDRYIRKIWELLEDGGFLFANIPACGEDSVFGEIFPLAFREWDDDATAQRCFRTIPVDSYGYPKNGHLIWADTSWWVGRFAGRGFERQVEIEKSLHKIFDAQMENISPARRAYYVFSKNGDPSRIKAIQNNLDHPV